MDPTTVFCPNGHCHARGQTGMGHIAIHSQKEQRFICHECHKTFSARKGTVFYRLRTSAETVVLGVTLLAHGYPLQAIVAAFSFDERTVAPRQRPPAAQPLRPQAPSGRAGLRPAGCIQRWPVAGAGRAG
jgi:hypothetical protein